MFNDKNFKQGLPPVVGNSPKIVILGTLPSDESIKRQKYYGNPRNQFWRIMDRLFSRKEAETDEDFVRRMGIALWDCCKSAVRVGSQDSGFIANTVEPNDLMGFLEQHPTIDTIVLNGKTKALSLFNTYFSEIKGFEIVSLTSTSGMAGGIDKKMKEWKILKELLNGASAID